MCFRFRRELFLIAELQFWFAHALFFIRELQLRLRGKLELDLRVNLQRSLTHEPQTWLRLILGEVLPQGRLHFWWRLGVRLFHRAQIRFRQDFNCIPNGDGIWPEHARQIDD